MQRIGIVGLGEVGVAMVRAFASTARSVRCLDTRTRSQAGVEARKLGIHLDTDVATFLGGVDVVLVAVPGRHAADIAAQLLPLMDARYLYADLTAKSVPIRDDIAMRCARSGVPFADVAIADTVSWPDRPIDLYVSGPASRRVAMVFEGTRFRPQVVNEGQPVSTELKLLRSVFTKGLSALLIETLVAAEKCGVQTEIRRTLSAFMQEDFDRIVTLLVGSSLKHARRRADEMEFAIDMLSRVLGVAPMTAATTDLLRRLADLTGERAEPQSGVEEVIGRLTDVDVFAGFGAPSIKLEPQ